MSTSIWRVKVNAGCKPAHFADTGDPLEHPRQAEKSGRAGIAELYIEWDFLEN